MPFKKMMDTAAVAKRIPCDPRHIRRLRARGLMPPPAPLGGILAWHPDVIEAWLRGDFPVGSVPVKRQRDKKKGRPRNADVPRSA